MGSESAGRYKYITSVETKLIEYKNAWVAVPSGGRAACYDSLAQLTKEILSEGFCTIAFKLTA